MEASAVADDKLSGAESDNVKLYNQLCARRSACVLVGVEQCKLSDQQPTEVLNRIDDLTCPVCQEMIDSHYVQLRCGHEICSTCAVKTSELGKCPSCRKPYAVGTRSFSMVQLIEKTHDLMHVVCPGCTIWVGTKQDLRRQHAVGNCANGWRYCSECMSLHSANGCFCSLVDCPFCFEQISLGSVAAEHEAVCAKMTFTCKEGICDERMSRDAIDEHRRACLKQNGLRWSRLGAGLDTWLEHPVLAAYRLHPMRMLMVTRAVSLDMKKAPKTVSDADVLLEPTDSIVLGKIEFASGDDLSLSVGAGWSFERVGDVVALTRRGVRLLVPLLSKCDVRHEQAASVVVRARAESDIWLAMRTSADGNFSVVPQIRIVQFCVSLTGRKQKERLKMMF
eukprot:TRINITY_DN27554_c0_g1_i1.p1 TRINITY_DN27554_c0_g1~~TRINITY_DN27554_c0_g1_i1.p1  ORF type:complete len:402 (+),score=50.21 TRINITY_DN27554_c0_g1_i1:29-1207(+)